MRLEYFQMIDRILACGDGRIEAEARVPEASPVFEGHFPGHPLMPGVLLVEAMAQASGWLILSAQGFARMPFLAAVKEAKLRGFATPGMALGIEARLVHDGSGFAMTAASISADGRRVCDAALTLRTLPFPSPGLADALRARAAEIGLPDAAG